MFSFSSISSALGGGKGILGGLSLLGSAVTGFLAAREDKKAAGEQAAQAKRERRTTDIQNARDAEARDSDRRQQLGALRARMAAAGMDLRQGSASHLLDLTRRSLDADDETARQFEQLDRQGLTSQIGAARRQRSAAGINQWLSPGISLLGGLGRL